MNHLIAYDSQIICARIATLLSNVQNVEVVGTVQTVPEVLPAVSTLLPDAWLPELMIK